MRKSLHHYISLWLGAVMLVVVLVLAAMLMFTDMWQDRMYGNKRVIMILLLLSYAAYRGYRMYNTRKTDQSGNP